MYNPINGFELLACCTETIIAAPAMNPLKVAFDRSNKKHDCCQLKQRGDCAGGTSATIHNLSIYCKQFEVHVVPPLSGNSPVVWRIQ